MRLARSRPPITRHTFQLKDGQSPIRRYTLRQARPRLVLLSFGPPLAALGALIRGNALLAAIGVLLTVAEVGIVVWYLRLPVDRPPEAN
jgi:hypothetical protein